MTGFTAEASSRVVSLESVLADGSGNVHGLVEDSGDFDLIGLDSVNEEVLAAAEGVAAVHDFIVSFAAWSEWILCGALHCRFHQFLIGRSLIFTPGLEGM
jgi:hypothetical protein